MRERQDLVAEAADRLAPAQLARLHPLDVVGPVKDPVLQDQVAAIVARGISDHDHLAAEERLGLTHAERQRALARAEPGAAAAPMAEIDLAEVARQADIISCATLSTEPLIRGAWLKPGQHIDLVGSYGYNGYDTDLGTSRRQVRDEDYHAYSWGVVVSVPLTFTTERGRYRAARLQQRQSETQLERVEQDIVVRVGNAAGQIETAQQRVQATRHARELAQSTLDSEVKRLRAGASTTFFVSQQQEILSSAEVREADAQSDYAKSLAEYDRQLGVTLAKLNITVEPPK